MTLVAAGDVAHQKAKTMRQSLEYLLRGKQCETRGREFQRKGHPVKSLAGFYYGRGIGDIQCEAGLDQPNPRQQKLDGWCGNDLL